MIDIIVSLIKPKLFKNGALQAIALCLEVPRSENVIRLRRWGMDELKAARILAQEIQFVDEQLEDKGVEVE
jgi:hypothetical protein